MSKAESLQAEINALRAALERVEGDHAQAIAAITAEGLDVTVTVLDSHGQAIQRPGLNPACKIISAAERMRRSLNRQIEALETDLRKIEKEQTPSKWAKYAPKERKSGRTDSAT